MWIYNGYAQERIKSPDTGLIKIVLVKCKGSGKKAELEAFKRLQDKIDGISSSRTLFSEAIGLYLVDIEKNLKPSSIRKARIELGTILKITGDAYLESITAGFIRKKFIQSGRSNRTLNGFLKIFKTFWMWAYRNDLVSSREVFDKLTPFNDTPKKERIQDKYLETEEMDVLLEAITEPRWLLLVKFLLLSGLRIGELVALDISDFSDGYIHVTKTYDSNNKVVTTAKTYESRRDVFIQAELLEVINKILEYRKWQAEVCGYESAVFFPDVDGGRLHYPAFAKYLKETSERVLHKRITPHTLRHSHCSMLASAGFPLEAISARLGHSDSRITKEIYLHRMKELKERENNQLNGIRLIQ